eukprot:scaffold137472_cov289-Phaeocystis_antarctica.AAC.1
MRYHALLLSGTTAITTTPPHPQQLYNTITNTTTTAADPWTVTGRSRSCAVCKHEPEVVQQGAKTPRTPIYG